MSDIGKDAKAFEEALKAVKVKPNLPKINVTLIWKNCKYKLCLLFLSFNNKLYKQNKCVLSAFSI